jgi:hypothetical protein
MSRCGRQFAWQLHESCGHFLHRDRKIEVLTFGGYKRRNTKDLTG